MTQKKILKTLKRLDFDKKLNETSLLFTDKPYSSTQVSFFERLVLKDAKKLKVSAVFFRRFPAKQSSIPQLFIIDNDREKLNNSELAEIHRKIWSSGIVPLYYVIDNTTIRIFDGHLPVDYNKSTKSISVNSIDSLSLTSKTHNNFKRYSASLFLNGSFWEQKENEQNFLCRESVEFRIIDGLKKIRKHFIEDGVLNKGLAHKVLVLSILVKYLEERKDENGNHVFPKEYLEENYQVKSFCEVLRNKKIVRLFEDLSLHFNGKIFELEENEKSELNLADLSNLANYLDASLDDQLVLWPLYSFEYLPVELISRIYEEFIDQRKDAVFTPIHLARLMVDESMPIENPKMNYKVIDVSCGSGIFLVTVFKRLVQWWQKTRFEQTGEIGFPNVTELKNILKNSVYGIDVEPDSVRLSVFSLSIALCDMLTPTQIWKELRFENLRQKNIFEGDFFQFLSERNIDKGTFDLVIGNPPFEEYNDEEFQEIIKKFRIDINFKIPQNQMALLFLQQAMPFLNATGLLCLVMPSGPLLYNNTLDFRRHFFSNFEIPQIFDFSALNQKSLLFERSVSTVVLFAYNRKPKPSHLILHITVKRTKSAKEKLFFEIDHYDLHRIPQNVAENDPIIWKTNFLGGDQLYYLVTRLLKNRKLGDYLYEMKKNAGWYYGEGYTYGNKSKKANHLTNKHMVETVDFTENGISGIKIENEKYFEGTREKNKKIFTAPHLLIKETPGDKKFAIQYCDYNLIFRNEIFGIYAPKGQEKELKNIETILQKNYKLFKMLLLSYSGRAGISRSMSTVLLKDFKQLPLPENHSKFELSVNEEIIMNDILDYKLDELSFGEEAEINTKKVSFPDLEIFGKIFCDNLNEIYQTKNGRFVASRPIQTTAYTCYPFFYGKKKPVIAPEIKNGDLSILIENEEETILYRRIIRLYRRDQLYLIKPNNLRYWLKSIAISDATDVMVDLINSGY